MFDTTDDPSQYYYQVTSNAMRNDVLANKTVTMYKNGNTILLDPTDDEIFVIVKAVLSFTEVKTHRGNDLRLRRLHGQSPVEIVEHSLLELDHKHRLVTNYGFWQLVRNALRARGYAVRLKDVTPVDEKKFKQYWNNIKQFKLKDNKNVEIQTAFLKAVLNNSCGRLDCPPGFGKSFMIGIIAALLPKARIDVVTRRVSVLRDRIYPELVQMVGDVGIVGGSKNIRNKRVMCYTAGSMGKAAADADILIGDEVHELAADCSSAELVRWQSSRNYGLSASHDMRSDNKDLRMHGVFGPVIYRCTYEQALAANMVVPIRVNWSTVCLDYNPCSGDKDVEKKRHGIWTNDARNIIIAEDARKYDDATQVLITVETIQHAMNLKKRLPEFTLVYMENGLTAQDRFKYAKHGFCASNEPLMDLDRRQKLTKDFESGTLKKVICTTVWNVGVSFNTLTVLIRGDGGGSAINSIQIPGRVSRTSAAKECGIVHDYMDQFDPDFKFKAKSRARSYKQHSWEQVFPTPSHMAEYLR